MKTRKHNIFIKECLNSSMIDIYSVNPYNGKKEQIYYGHYPNNINNELPETKKRYNTRLEGIFKFKKN